MGLDPDYREQELMAEAIERRSLRLSAKEQTAEAAVGGLYVVAAAILLLAAPPDLAAVSAVGAVGALLALILALRVEFDVGTGFTVPSQLAFVPLLFVLPPSLAPVAVPVAWALAKLPEVVGGDSPPGRLLTVPGNSWFAIGPAAVLALTGVDSPAAAVDAPFVLLLALAAQFAGDFGACALRELITGGETLRELVGEAWVYGVDTALAPAGLIVAFALDESVWSVFALIPLLGVLSLFARERRARVASLGELNHAYRGMSLVLGDVVEADDSYTGEHCRDVVDLATASGRRLGLDASRLRNLEFGALLHDVGKVVIPKEIINKPGKLDEREWEIVRTHTIEGQIMLDRVGGFMSEVGVIVRSHHERWDGDGYPDGLAGEAIPLEARIIACCDTWNAMTTTRSYRAALSAEVAAQELRDCSGTQFDPAIVAAVLDATGVRAPAPAAVQPIGVRALVGV